jgi:hypothetical protein
MALVIHALRSAPAVPRTLVGERPTRTAAPPEPPQATPVAAVDEATRRERVRMDLLVARARAART